MHNGHMTTLQAVVTMSGDSRGDLSFHEVSDNGRPSLLRHPESGERVPNFASADLLRIASFAERSGYVIVGLQLADARLDLLADRQQGEVADVLLEAYELNGLVGLESELNNSYPRFLLVGITLLSTGDRSTLNIRRNGVLRTDNAASESLLRRAWKAIKIS